LTFRGNITNPKVIVQILSADVCKEVREFEWPSKPTTAFVENVPSKYFYEGKNVPEQYCSIGFQITLTSKTDDGRLIVVAELTNGLYFAPHLSESYNGYIIYPDQYNVHLGKAIVLPYAFVSSGGKMLLFQRP